MSGSTKQRVRWTPEMQKYLLLHCMKPTKEIDAEGIAATIPNATEKCIIEQISKLIRQRKVLDAKVLAAKAAAPPAVAPPAVAPVNRQGAKKAKNTKARVPKAGSSKDGLKRKRVKQEASDTDDGWIDKEIGGAASDDDEDHAAEEAMDVVATATEDTNADADIDG